MTFVKTVFAASTALVALATTAQAGGYVAPAVEAEPLVVAPVVATDRDWTGAYGGVTLAYACCGDDEVGLRAAPDPVAVLGDLNLSGANYGLRIGYRWQRMTAGRDMVFGAELGYETGSISDAFDDAGNIASNDVDSVLGLRFKTGVLNQPQSTLFYGIAGVVRGSFDYVVDGTAGGATMDYADTIDMTGYVVGLGVERKLTERLSLTGEWEYANFGETTVLDATDVETVPTPDYHNFKLGLNLSF